MGHFVAHCSLFIGHMLASLMHIHVLNVCSGQKMVEGGGWEFGKPSGVVPFFVHVLDVPMFKCLCDLSIYSFGQWQKTFGNGWANEGVVKPFTTYGYWGRIVVMGWQVCSNLYVRCQMGVVCGCCLSILKFQRRGGGCCRMKHCDALLALDLASLSTMSLPSNPECAQILWRIIG